MTRLLRLTMALSALTLFGTSLPATAGQDKAGKPVKEKKEKPTQASVAAKTKFGEIKEGDAAVKKALTAKDLEGAKKLVGKEGAFHGKVVKVFTARGNTLLILNFDENYKEALTAVLRSADFAKFPDMDALKDKHVLVKGKFVLYKDQPQIALTAPAQIKIIK